MLLRFIKPIQNKIAGLRKLAGNFFPWVRNKNIKHIHSKKRKALSPEKQAKLEALCQQLFKNRDWITSGKFQLIGLNEIKKKMGKQWEGLSKIVYETTEDVFDKYMDKGDVFIRYHDDSYIIIFAHATLEESREKIERIAEEIKQRLFALDEEELRNIQIRRLVNEMNSESFMESGFLDDMFGPADDGLEDLNIEFPEEEEEDFSDDVLQTAVGTDYQIQKVLENEDTFEMPELAYSYLPLWDTKRGALTTYLCLARNKNEAENISLYQTHKTLYQRISPTGKLVLDKAILAQVASRLQKILEEQKKFFIVCPIHHETVYNMESYERYKEALLNIPQEYRQFLLLLIMDTGGSSKRLKNPYWFAKPLRTMSPHVFAEIPLWRNINFNYLNNSGVDVVGVRIDKQKANEQETITLLNNFSAKAKLLKISQTFILDVPSLSITTSAICSGFDFLGGSAIHDPVEKPDNVHRYQHADLIKGFTPNG